MKANTWILIGGLLAFQGARAESKPVAAGMLGGLNAATLWGHNVHDFDVRFWPEVGFSLNVRFPVLVGLETDLLYASRGSTFKSDDSAGSRVNTFHLQTLTLPLLVKITAPIGYEVQPVFFGGPSLAYAFSKSNTSEVIATDVNGNVTTENLDPLIPPADLQTLDVLLTVGGGLEWGLGTLQARLNFGERPLDKTGVVDVHTFTLDVMAGFTF